MHIDEKFALVTEELRVKIPDLFDAKIVSAAHALGNKAWAQYLMFLSRQVKVKGHKEARVV